MTNQPKKPGRVAAYLTAKRRVSILIDNLAYAVLHGAEGLGETDESVAVAVLRAALLEAAAGLENKNNKSARSIVRIAREKMRRE